ncbi:competence/damage-inducible protein A [Halioxenophilus sp. WMMB6]|uniref:competence/damage-inducible protein A n=1 Tax=Halioxenophilus sp. WMMB6 TaxID=3073815 RepID=UPI00295E5CFF|nr:molybdopterin-binding protein [Halioxenophilus sp. WMMB6]
MAFGLIIIGDEILSGRRQDRQLPILIKLLSERGLQLGWVQILPDEMDVLVATFRRTLAQGDTVFCTGGLGSTPDDLTRDAFAQALGVTTEIHPEGRKLLEDFSSTHQIELAEEHWQLITFPKGAELIVDPIHKVPGFGIANHYFMPGFPEMAEPMMAWVLDNHYGGLVNPDYQEDSILVLEVFESHITDLMEAMLAQFPQTKLFSLPMMVEGQRQVEVGFKGHKAEVEQALTRFKAELDARQIEWRAL